MKSDIFISHAREDKETVARPLAQMLKNKGYTVWFDDFVLTLGDSIRQAIDKGLASCRFGVVILSPNFFAKEWPQRELDGLAAREVASGEKLILPVWHNISHSEIRKYSPMMADKLGISTASGIEFLTGRIAEVVGGIILQSEVQKTNQPLVRSMIELRPVWMQKYDKVTEEEIECPSCGSQVVRYVVFTDTATVGEAECPNCHWQDGFTAI